MADPRTPLFVRLPRHQAVALDRMADATGRQKQHLLSELLADRLTVPDRPLAVGRVEVTPAADPSAAEVLTLEEVAALLKLPAELVRSRAERGELPGRRFGDVWRFARTAVLAWLGKGERTDRVTGAPSPPRPSRSSKAT
jgi:excisionase family DNA binding protein